MAIGIDYWGTPVYNNLIGNGLVNDIAPSGYANTNEPYLTNTGSNDGFNWDTALGWGKLGLQAAALPFQIYGGLQTVKLARDQLRNAQAQFNWQKRIDTANMNNQIQTTNAANYDRAVARASGAGGTAAQQAAMANDTYNRYKLDTNW